MQHPPDTNFFTPSAAPSTTTAVEMEAQVLKLLAEKRAERQQEMEKYVRDPEETETDTENEQSDYPALDRF